jgi:hypothetical protein
MLAHGGRLHYYGTSKPGAKLSANLDGRTDAEEANSGRSREALMPYLDEFRGPDGLVDWDALASWERAHGERCTRCNAMIIFHEKDGVPALCGSCQAMDLDEGEVSHERLLRCPHCKHQMKLPDPTDYSQLWEEGRHEIDCDECGKEFSVEVRVSYYFTSPKLEEEKEEAR